MKHFLFLVFILSFFFSSAQTRSVLFLGNSYTNANNLPKLISDIADSQGDSVIYDSNTPGGYTLQGHATNATSLNKIKSKNWDYVVIQEQSQKPSFPPTQVQTDVFPYAKQLVDSINNNDSCTKALFYMTWGRKYGDQSNCQFYTPLCTYAGMQQELRTNYVQMAIDNQSSVAPVGQAWKRSIAIDSSLNLYQPDNSHPNIYGSYLAACVFYSSIFHKSSVLSYHPASISANVALQLQLVADSTVFDSLSIWLIDTTNALIPSMVISPTSTFNYSFAGNSTISNSNYFWDFGDGSTSQLQNPTHTYSSPGQYIISLTVSKNCLENTLEDTINIISTTINGISQKQEIAVYPNPFSETFNLKLNSESSYVKAGLFDVQGRLLEEKECFNCLHLNFNYFNKPGIYFIKVTTDDSSETIRLVKED